MFLPMDPSIYLEVLKSGIQIYVEMSMDNITILE